MKAIANLLSATVCLASGLVLCWATLIAGLSANYSLLRQWPDEVLLSVAFVAGVAVPLVTGKTLG